jgi:recombination protein RecR
MDIYPASVERLIEALTHLPTIGRKSAQRLAMSIVDKPEEEVKRLAEALLEVKERVMHCEICHNLADGPICLVCEDETRDHSVICVVEDVQGLIAIEKTKSYHGLYHVLGGLLNPMQGIGPQELDLNRLVDRIGQDDVKELVFAISPTVEGEMTAHFIRDVVKDTGIRLSRIASGIPIGASLEYFDDMTLIKALEERRSMDA